MGVGWVWYWTVQLQGSFKQAAGRAKQKLLLQHMLLIVLRKNSEVENQKFGLGNFTIK